MELTREELDRVAAIARLELDDDEAAALREDLDKILERFATLATALEDVDQADAAIPMEGGLRDDVVEPADPETVAGIQRAFPRRRDGLVEVPRGL